MTDYKYIDLNYLNDLALGSKDFIEDMISSFLKNTPESLVRMETALVKNDWEQIGKIAHKVKTSFTFMGMEETVVKAKTLQDYGLKTTNQEEIPGLISDIKVAYNNAEVELNVELTALKAEL
jgi:HPt (histidine-containing phosphotransfer) domain-containing protein